MLNMTKNPANERAFYPKNHQQVSKDRYNETATKNKNHNELHLQKATLNSATPQTNKKPPTKLTICQQLTIAKGTHAAPFDPLLAPYSVPLPSPSPRGQAQPLRREKLRADVEPTAAGSEGLGFDQWPVKGFFEGEKNI